MYGLSEGCGGTYTIAYALSLNNRILYWAYIFPDSYLYIYSFRFLFRIFYYTHFIFLMYSCLVPDSFYLLILYYTLFRYIRFQAHPGLFLFSYSLLYPLFNIFLRLCIFRIFYCKLLLLVSVREKRYGITFHFIFLSIYIRIPAFISYLLLYVCLVFIMCLCAGYSFPYIISYFLYSYFPSFYQYPVPVFCFFSFLPVSYCTLRIHLYFRVVFSLSFVCGICFYRRIMASGRKERSKIIFFYVFYIYDKVG